MIHIFVMRRYTPVLLHVFSLFFITVLGLTLLPATAHADGGAPNLAYVAGTAKGVSVIDVAQQRITSTISTSGDPHTIALSIDGRFLYVSLPQQGQVAVIAAKTGETFCTANVPGQPDLLALDNTTNTLFAAGGGAASVSAIDPTNCSIKRTYQTQGPVFGLAIAAVGSSVSGSGNQLWVADSKTLSIFDDLNGRLLGTVDIAGGPRYVSIPPGATVYVATQQGAIVAVDLNTRKTTTLLSGGTFGPMDYDQTTGEVYVPDQQGSRLLVLAPLNTGFAPPKEPSHIINLDVKPESVAITSDGQLGFVALQNGNVAMLDLPGGKRVVNTINVGGSPHFIITGLYPPLVGTTPQQTAFWGTIINIAAYIFIIALFLVPIFLFRRYMRTQSAKEDNTPSSSD